MRGFTLLEVVIALAIMAGVILTVISAINHHLSITIRDREETVALLLAGSKLEEIELTQKDDLKTGQEGTFAPQHPDIKWKAEVEPTPITYFKKLTLTVTWGNEKRSLSLVRYVAK